MTSLSTDAFALPDHLSPKADPALIGADQQHFAVIAQTLEQTMGELSDRLDAERKAPGGTGQAAMDRDNEIHRLSARLRTLRRFSLDLCLGRMVSADSDETVYVGRLGLTDRDGRRLLVDWRSPVAEPFFAATHANPMGLASRRRYRWTRGRVSDYWDEVFTPDGLEGHAALTTSPSPSPHAQTVIVDETAWSPVDPDLLAGPFAHVVVDEAQELTDAEWQMLLGRCPSRSFTIVGDRAQARQGFAESWVDRLQRIGLDRVTLASLSVNYRTPEEVMAEAEPVIRAALPDANVPTSIRCAGLPVVHGSAADLDSILEEWLATHADGVACAIGAPTLAETRRVRSLSAEHVKGLEFDLVVLVDPEAFGTGIEGTVDRYVAMTRATQQLVILTTA